MRIMVDLDGCGTDFATDALTVCELRENRKLEDPICWDFPVEQWGMDYETFWRHIEWGVNAGLVWNQTPPTPGFVAALTVLQQMGHTIHICTARRGYERVTMKWLHRFGVPFDSVTVVGHDKTILDADLAIDDSPGNWQTLSDAGVPCVLFDQPWNRHIDAATRVSSWGEFVELVALNDLDLAA